MKRVAILFTVLVIVLGTLLGVRLRSQAQALRGPVGGSAEIEGTQIDLGSRVGARIERLHVRKGDAVTKGALLVSFDCSDARAAVAEAEARLRAAQAQASAVSRLRTQRIQSAQRSLAWRVPPLCPRWPNPRC